MIAKFILRGQDVGNHVVSSTFLRILPDGEAMNKEQSDEMTRPGKTSTAS